MSDWISRQIEYGKKLEKLRERFLDVEAVPTEPIGLSRFFRAKSATALADTVGFSWGVDQTTIVAFHDSDIGIRVFADPEFAVVGDLEYMEDSDPIHTIHASWRESVLKAWKRGDLIIKAEECLRKSANKDRLIVRFEEETK